VSTLREKIDAAIASQQGEVERLANVAKIELPAAQMQLRQLRALADQLEKTPEVEAGYAALKTLGIKLDV
jgi:hypothetical protein